MRVISHQLRLPSWLAQARLLVMVLALCATVAIPAAFAATGINRTINYQGKLSSTGGTVLVNGAYNMRFKIFSSPTGGVALWTERWDNTTERVTATGGLFSIALGTHIAMTGSVNFNSDALYLQVEFDPGNDGVYEEVFTPRRRFASVPYAHNADMLDGLDAAMFMRKDQSETASGTLTIKPNDASKIGLDIISQGGIAASAALRISTQGANHILFGSGGLNYDTNLYRSAANILKTDDAFYVVGTLSGSIVKADRQLMSSGSLAVEGDATIDDTTFVVDSANNRVGVGTNQPKTALEVLGTASGTNIFASQSMTGTHLYVAMTFNGAGLADCDNAGTSKLLWDSTTKQFSCGTDQSGGGGASSFSTGSVLSIGDARYVNQSGDTMTGALVIDLQGGSLQSIGLTVVNAFSGALVHAEKGFTTSGSLVVSQRGGSPLIRLTNSGSDTAMLFEMLTNGSGPSNDDDGPNNPGTAATDTTSGSNSWSDPNNSFSSDDNRATAWMSSGFDTYYLKATNFGFSIPPNATVLGITATIEKSFFVGMWGDAEDKAVRIVKNDTIGSTDRSSATAWSSTDATTTYGGSSDLWGETWTANDINQSTFGIVIRAGCVGGSCDGTARVDHIQLSVAYQIPGDSTVHWSLGGDNSDGKKFKLSLGSALGTNDVITANTSAFVGFGTTNPAERIHASGALLLDMETTSATRNVFKIISDVASNEDTAFRIRADGTTYSDNSYWSSGADYAEWFKDSSAQHGGGTGARSLKPGEVVCIDVTADNTVKRCDRDGDDNVMGIVSTKPAFVGNVISGAEGIIPPGYVLVGLIGQVPTHVLVQSGASIRPGDSLTAAGIPGFARKAKAGESTVGVALEPLVEGKGVINVLISRRNQSLTAQAVEDNVLATIKAMEIDDEVQHMVSTTIRSLTGSVAFRDIIAREVGTVDFSTRIDALVARQLSSTTMRVDALHGAATTLQSQMSLFGSGLTLLDTGYATLSSKLDALSGSVLRVNASGSVLMGSGRTLSAQSVAVEELLVSRTLKVDGLSILTGRATIGPLSVSGSTVQIGSLAATGALKIIGDMTVSGLVEFGSDVHVKGRVVLSNKQAGFATIPATGTSVTVRFNAPMAGTPIVTATPDIPVLFGVFKVTASGFVIRVIPPATEKITFTYIALSADNPMTIEGTGAVVHAAAFVPFPVTTLGVPVSSDAVWNSCIRGQPLVIAGDPVSCARYHDGYVWDHPDLPMSFTYNPNHEPPILLLPNGYTQQVIDEGQPNDVSASDGIFGQQQTEPEPEAAPQQSDIIQDDPEPQESTAEQGITETTATTDADPASPSPLDTVDDIQENRVPPATPTAESVADHAVVTETVESAPASEE